MLPLDELASVSAWLDAPAQRREDLVAAVGGRLGLRPLGIARYGGGDIPIGSLRHEASGVVFRLLPGGTFQMGLSAAEFQALEAIMAVGAAHSAEWEAADEGLRDYPEALPGHFIDPDILDSFLHSDEVEAMRPAHPVTLAPFLIASHALTAGESQAWLPGPVSPGFGPRDRAVPADEVRWFKEEEFAILLQRWPFQLPTEAQWEYAARATTTTLCFGGNAITDFVAEDDLLSVYGDAQANARNENQFGLHGLGSDTELCADEYVAGYHGAPADGSARVMDGAGPWVTRSGMLRPAQGCDEWVALLSACRGADRERFGTVRPTLSL